MPPPKGKDAAWVTSEASKCMYCGFCEAVCPTLPLGPHRGYGPRGRVYLANVAAREGRLGAEGAAGIYSCLLCAACVERCPAGIDIPGIVRAVRRLLAEGRVAAPSRVYVRVL